ncbi:permease prefix domain 1-containing protein [Paenibacillus oceani]|uniref:Beta-carotene 15,15'-monooxygenase n=1 Tax=Paenibacillus oceani TaxID=2772510 RepID=A0A927GZB2_9BACL|nr:permease prefix domain 1-containing protein [Paenibacillus oceani]MBD2862801.1 hypothetical protein [Paenibacillus oceani]
MDTIIGYLDNMFASLPKNDQTIKLKQDLLATMEEKYYELKHEGKSENEAVGIVISEFGNIDELASELGLSRGREEKSLRHISDWEAEEYATAKRKSGFLIGLGIFLCITGVALLVLLTNLSEDGLLGPLVTDNTGGWIGLIAMFMLMVPAIAMFIYSGTKLNSFHYMQGEFVIPHALQTYIRHKQIAFTPTFTLALIVGVCLCVMSPVMIFAASVISEDLTVYGVAAMLLMIAVAVFLFTYYGNIKNSFSVLLQEGDYSQEKKEENRVVGAVAAIVWPIATCAFLISGLVYQQWHINWIIFPVTGILFGMFSAVYNISRGNRAS